ncbi:Hypothetical protein SRAE_2000429200 [Strongyloides ratti]|uniref:Uncharacterized protein n=1 Tax=Strongyloides ratti TaxID=34506 RepID=A0A090MZW5_STRRB|nr:Hypothetical protein SRAE_2000429200 [Strongyloides ratti]CEF69645.1 Hypothetical protein SRAE_2000429200 [Strongyloides ratti]
MLQSIRNFLNFVYGLIFGETNNKKKKKYVYDREYKEYQRAFASGEYIEDEYGNEYSDGGNDYYPTYYIADEYESSPTSLSKKTQLRKRRIRRKKILRKPPFIKTEDS